MVATRNSLMGNNLNVSLALHNTEFDKEKLFDKIAVSMITDCSNRITIDQATWIMNSDNVTVIKSPNENILRFDPMWSEIEPEFSEEELRVLRVMYTV